MPTKVKELTPISEAKQDDSRCVICYPPDPRKRVREDQLWGECPTNAQHQHGSGSDFSLSDEVAKSEPPN